MTDLSPLLFDHPATPLLKRIGEIAASCQIPAFAVGGMVRDALLGRPTTDIDVVTLGEGTSLALAEAVSEALQGRKVHVYENFGTAALSLPEEWGGLALEFVAARRESYRRSSRKPLVESGSLADDLARRDFTVNAMALDLHPDRFAHLHDPFGGIADLQARRLRTPLDPARTFDDDPLRMLRAARFAAQLHFEIVPEVLMAMPHVAERLSIVSPERIHEELQKLIVTERPSEGLWVLKRGGLLSEILPELTDLGGVEAVDGVGHKDNFAHSLQVLDNLARATADRPLEEVRYLRWTALLHDIGKSRTKRFVEGTGWTFHGHEEVGARMVPKVFRRLAFPLDGRLEYVQKLIRLHHRPHALVDNEVTDSAVRRLLFDAGVDADDLMALVRADITSKNPRRVQKYLRGFDRVEEKMRDVEARDQIRTFQPPVDGHEIMQVLGVREGLAVGILKDQIKEAILDGEIPNEHDAAFAFMMAHKDEALRRGRLFEQLRGLLTPSERRSMGVLKDALMVEPLAEDPAEDLVWLNALRVRVLTPMESHSYTYQPAEEPTSTPSDTH